MLSETCHSFSSYKTIIIIDTLKTRFIHSKRYAAMTCVLQKLTIFLRSVLDNLWFENIEPMHD